MVDGGIAAGGQALTDQHEDQKQDGDQRYPVQRFRPVLAEGAEQTEQESPDHELADRYREAPTLAMRAANLMRRMKNANPVIVVMLSCFTPGMPNGIIPHVAARTDIPFSSFVEAIVFSGWLQILLFCVAGHLLMRGDYLISVIFILLQFLVFMSFLIHLMYGVMVIRDLLTLKMALFL